MYKRIVRTQHNLSAEAWKNITSASFKISKMVYVTPILQKERLSDNT